MLRIAAACLALAAFGEAVSQPDVSSGSIVRLQDFQSQHAPPRTIGVWLVEELKPSIDERFSVHTDPGNTFVMGSSMGGLISLYALTEYPEVFGGAGCLSTHWPSAMEAIPELMLDYLRTGLPQPGSHRVYFDHGTVGLDASYAPYQQQVDAVMVERGFSEADWLTLVFEGADHHEKAWAARLARPMVFLLGENHRDSNSM